MKSTTGSKTLLLSLLFVMACSPTQRTDDALGSGPQSQQATGPKVLTVAIQREPGSFDPDMTGATANSNAGGAANVRDIVHDGLTARTDSRGYEPRLAMEMPSSERGTWTVNADGTMDMTWKLRPNIKWHDGTPFTSEDMAFTFQVRRDPEIARVSGGGGRPDLMESASAPDPYTFIVHWSRVYVRADESGGLGPLPKHLLDDLYRQDKEAMTQSRYFFTGFVGLGAFKLDRWEQGSHVEFSRFDDYFLNRPPLDRVVVRFVPDGNTMVANILSGAVDVVLPEGVDLDAAFEVHRLWEGTGNQIRFDVLGGLHQLEIQHRPEYARPSNGLTNRLVRHALYHAIDRQTLTDVMTQGLAPYADSYYAPNDAFRKDVEAHIPQYPYDPARAGRILESEGWVRGADGVLVHRASGERFQTEIQLRPGDAQLRAGQIIGDGWKTVGVHTDFEVLTGVVLNDGQHLALRPGPALISPSGSNFYDRRLHSGALPGPQNRWSGNNRGGFSSPRVDTLLDRLAVTVDTTERANLHRDLLQEQMGELALMPLYWQVEPILMVAGVSGPKMQGNVATPNIYEWDKR